MNLNLPPGFLLVAVVLVAAGFLLPRLRRPARSDTPLDGRLSAQAEEHGWEFRGEHEPRRHRTEHRGERDGVGWRLESVWTRGRHRETTFTRWSTDAAALPGRVVLIWPDRPAGESSGAADFLQRRLLMAAMQPLFTALGAGPEERELILAAAPVTGSDPYLLATDPADAQLLEGGAAAAIREHVAWSAARPAGSGAKLVCALIGPRGVTLVSSGIATEAEVVQRLEALGVSITAAADRRRSAPPS